jgi:hypothetical protein
MNRALGPGQQHLLLWRIHRISPKHRRGAGEIYGGPVQPKVAWGPRTAFAVRGSPATPRYHFFHRAGHTLWVYPPPYRMGAVALAFMGGKKPQGCDSELSGVLSRFSRLSRLKNGVSHLFRGVAEDLPLSRQVFWSFALQNSPTKMQGWSAGGADEEAAARICRRETAPPSLFTLPTFPYSLLPTPYSLLTI